jgi:hypothetical protein
MNEYQDKDIRIVWSKPVKEKNEVKDRLEEVEQTKKFYKTKTPSKKEDFFNSRGCYTTMQRLRYIYENRFNKVIMDELQELGVFDS